MAFSLGQLFFSIKADTAELVRGMGEAKAIVSEGVEHIRGAAALAQNALTLIGIGIGAHELVEGIQRYGEMVDELGKIAEQSGISAQSLQGLQYAAQQNDTEFESLTQGLKKLRVNQVDAINGSAELRQTFLHLGISVSDLEKLSPEELFLRVADGVQGLGNEADRTNALVKIMGKGGDDLGVLMNQGAEGIRAAMNEAKEFGRELDDRTIQAIKATKDNFDALKTSAIFLGNDLAHQLAPSLERTSNAMKEAAKDGGILRAAWVGLGGVLAESFNLNDTPLEQVESEIKDITTQLQITEQAMQGLAHVPGAELDRLTEKAGRLKDQLQLLQSAQAELSKPDQKPEPAFTGIQVSVSQEEIISAAEASVRGLKEQIQASIALADANDKTVQGLQAQVSALGQAEGAVELYKLATNGATAEQLALAKAAIQARAAFAEQQAQLQKSSDDFERWTAIRAAAMTDEEATTARLFDRYQELDEIVSRHPELAAAAAETRKKLQDQELQAQDKRMEAILKQQDDERQATLEHRSRLGDIDAEWEIKSREFSELTARGKTKYVLGQLTTLTAGVAQHSRTAFEANKALSIASAIMNTYEMATGSYKALASIPYVGPYLGAAAAAAALAFGFAQVQAINSTTFSGGSGGGTTPSAAGSTPVVNGNPVTSSTPTFGSGDAVPTTQIIIQGNLYSNNAEQTLADLKSLINDGDHVLIENHSRQASELRSAA